MKKSFWGSNFVEVWTLLKTASILFAILTLFQEPGNLIQSPDRPVLEPINNLPPGSLRSDSQKGTPNRTFSGMRRMNSLADTSLNTSKTFGNISTNTPQKDASYLGKTMSYIFGEW